MMQGSFLQNLVVKNTLQHGPACIWKPDVAESRGNTGFLRQSSAPGFMAQISGQRPTPQQTGLECYAWMVPAHFENVLPYELPLECQAPNASRHIDCKDRLDIVLNALQESSNDSDDLSTAEQMSRQTSQNSGQTSQNSAGWSGRTSELPDRTPSPVRRDASWSARGLPTVSLPASPQNMPRPGMPMARGCGMPVVTNTSVTVRNLPPGFTKEVLLQELRDAGFQRDRDFDHLYLSSDVGSVKSDSSLFIINLVNETVRWAFTAAFDGRELHCDRSNGHHAFSRCLAVAATTAEERQAAAFPVTEAGPAMMQQMQRQQQVASFTAPTPRPLPMQHVQQEARFCYDCGGPIKRNFRFCVQCGASLQDLRWTA